MERQALNPSGSRNVSHASSPALDQSAKAGAGPAAISARKARRAEARNASDRAFLDHFSGASTPGWRLYLVLLLGRERRTISRLYSQGMVSGRFNVMFYLGLGRCSCSRF